MKKSCSFVVNALGEIPHLYIGLLSGNKKTKND